MTTPRQHWTDDQVTTLRQLYPTYKTEDVATVVGKTTKQAYQKAFSLGLKKSAEFYASPTAGRFDGLRGSSHRFVKGMQPWNKGIPHNPAGSEVARFKKGNKPHHTAAIGAYRINRDGTLQQKVSDERGAASKRWRGVHEQVWIAANGAVPTGCVVVFKAGMRTTTPEEITAERVECITLAENMQRNTVHRYPKEIQRLAQLRGALNRQINRKEKNERQPND